MPVIEVVGAVWGDEGKGKAVDFVVEKKGVDAVMRVNGGPNAGHVVVKDDDRILDYHQLTTGVCDPDIDNLLGAGVVVNLSKLHQETEKLAEKGVNGFRLYIHPAAHLILAYNQTLDGIEDDQKGGDSLGTTRQGIGPAYADKADRIGLRAELINEPDEFMKALQKVLPRKVVRYRSIYPESPLPDEFYEGHYEQAVHEWRREFGPLIRNTSRIIREHLQNGRRVLVEGAQGTRLDINEGDYPYVTSSGTTAGELLALAGIPPAMLKPSELVVLGIIKAGIFSRVGAGPFPTEAPEELQDEWRDETERGATTDRPRRLGYPDGVILLEAQEVNLFTHAMLGKIDWLYGRGPIKVCIGYELNGRRITRFPDNSRDLAKCKPIYLDRTFELKENITGVTRYVDLPEDMQALCDLQMSFMPGAQLSLVGTGRKTSQMIDFRNL